MKQEPNFVLHSTYDKAAYQALSEASWVLFRRRRMQTAAYPTLVTMALLTTFLLIYNWNTLSSLMRVAGIAFVLFNCAAIPLGATSAKAKMCRTAIREATKRGEFPAEVTFRFYPEEIHAAFGSQVSSVSYQSIDCLIALGEWRLLFFGHAAYILHTSCFPTREALEQFEEYLTQRCGLPFNQMKGSGPRR